MSDGQSTRPVNGDTHPRNQIQSNKGQSPVSPNAKSKLRAQLGLETSGNQDWQKQIREIKKLLEESGKFVVEGITLYLDDKQYNEIVRMEALRALLELSRRKTMLVLPGPFITALYDKDAHVRATAVEVVTVYGAWRLPDQVLLDLMNRLDDKVETDHVVRVMIVHLLASLAKRAHLQPVLPNEYYSSVASISKAAFQTLLTCLQDEEYQIREAAVIALRPLVNDLPPDKRGQLDAMLYDDDNDVRETARLILQEHLPPGQSLEERLRNDLLAPSSTKRSQAARSLGEIGDITPVSVQALFSIAQDPQVKSEVREAALLSLAGQHLPPDAISKEALNRLLNEEEESVSDAALILANTLDPKRYPLDKAEPTSVEVEKPLTDKVIDFEQRRNKHKTMPKDTDPHGA